MILARGSKKLKWGKGQMANNNYNKYFKSKEIKENTKEVKENTNDKNVSGTSLVVEPENEIKPEQETEQADPIATKAAVISGCRLNVREKPNTLSGILCVLEPGTNILAEYPNGDWAHIYTEHGIDGYVMKEYIIISQL